MLSQLLLVIALASVSVEFVHGVHHLQKHFLLIVRQRNLPLRLSEFVLHAPDFVV